MNDQMINLLNKPPCNCDKKYVEDLGLAGHFANCQFIASLNEEELALYHPSEEPHTQDEIDEVQKGLAAFEDEQHG